MDRLSRFRQLLKPESACEPGRHPDSAAARSERSGRYADHSLLDSAGPMLLGLEQLLRAFNYATDVGCDAWDFALEIQDLRVAGLTKSDLRWLVRKRYVEHAREISLPGEERRSFRPARGPSFTKRTCFVLTAGGAVFVRGFCERWAADTMPAADGGQRTEYSASQRVVPRWDRDLQELCVDGVIVKRFKVPAPNQEVVLAAFEEEGWPPRIDDPLPPHPEQDPKRRLHDTINSLNRNHKHRLIRFMGDGSGQGVRWMLMTNASGDDGVPDERE